MPRPPAPCPHPTCTALVPGGGRCPLHKRQANREASRTRRLNSDGSERWYSTSQWRTLKRRYLASHPSCATCGARATAADHRIPRRILIAAGIHNPDADRWLQPLCEPCHNRKTSTTDRPLLKRLDDGEDAATIAEEVGYTP